MVSPIIVEWTYTDGTKETEVIPAEIWRKNELEASKVFLKEKEVVNIVIDPDKKTADINTANNVFPKQEDTDRFDQFKEGKDGK